VEATDAFNAFTGILGLDRVRWSPWQLVQQCNSCLWFGGGGHAHARLLWPLCGSRCAVLPIGRNSLRRSTIPNP